MKLFLDTNIFLDLILKTYNTSAQNIQKAK